MEKRASEVQSIEDSEVDNPQMGEDYERIQVVNDELSEASEEEISIGEDTPPVILPKKKQTPTQEMNQGSRLSMNNDQRMMVIQKVKPLQIIGN